MSQELRVKIRAAKTVTDVIGLIPEMRKCYDPRTIMLYYDKAKEIAVYCQANEIDYEIFRVNFVDQLGNIDPEKDRDFANFIIRGYILMANSYDRLLMIDRYINEDTDPNLANAYHEKQELLKPPKQA